MEANRRATSSLERRSAPPVYVTDEEAIERWAAWYDGLPDDLRDALDERGRNAGKDAPAR
jgi:hypothetical protein